MLERMDQLAPFRRRLVEVPLGLDLPYWIEDPDFDIDFHVRHHAVPPPGTPNSWPRSVSRIHARPLDRGQAAVGAVRHRGVRRGAPHRPADQGPPRHDRRRVRRADAGRHPRHRPELATDGRSGRVACPTPCRPTSNCCGAPLREYLAPAGEAHPPLGPHAPRRRRVHPERRRSGRSPTSSPSRCPARSARCSANASASGRATTSTDPPALPTTPAPRTPWNASIGPHRRFAFTTHLARGRQPIRRAAGCTFNDVVMALCSGTLRRYLHRARRPARRIADRHGARQRAHGRRGRHVPEPGVDAARRPGDERGRPVGPAASGCRRA